MKEEGGRLRARSEPSRQRVFLAGTPFGGCGKQPLSCPRASEWVGGAYYKSPRIAKFFASENVCAGNLRRRALARRDARPNEEARLGEAARGPLCPVTFERRRVGRARAPKGLKKFVRRERTHSTRSKST